MHHIEALKLAIGDETVTLPVYKTAGRLLSDQLCRADVSCLLRNNKLASSSFCGSTEPGEYNKMIFLLYL